MKTWQRAVKRGAIILGNVLIAAIIGGIVNVTLALIGDDSGLTEMRAYTVEQTESIDSLNLEINAAELVIQTGESFAVESNIKKFTVNTKNNTLVLLETTKYTSCGEITYSGKNTPKISLTIPADKHFKNVNITTGAGKFTLQQLSADRLSFSLGAGEVVIDNLYVTQMAEIEGGAGKITVKNGAMKNMSFDMGVGELSLQTQLLGNCELNCGVGEVNVVLLGEKESYQVTVSKGLGNATIDGQKVNTQMTVGTGENRFNTTGGIGSLTIQFKE